MPVLSPNKTVWLFFISLATFAVCTCLFWLHLITGFLRERVYAYLPGGLNILACLLLLYTSFKVRLSNRFINWLAYVSLILAGGMIVMVVATFVLFGYVMYR